MINVAKYTNRPHGSVMGMTLSAFGREARFQWTFWSLYQMGLVKFEKKNLRVSTSQGVEKPSPSNLWWWIFLQWKSSRCNKYVERWGAIRMFKFSLLSQSWCQASNRVRKRFSPKSQHNKWGAWKPPGSEFIMRPSSRQVVCFHACCPCFQNSFVGRKNGSYLALYMCDRGVSVIIQARDLIILGGKFGTPTKTAIPLKVRWIPANEPQRIIP